MVFIECLLWKMSPAWRSTRPGAIRFTAGFQVRSRPFHRVPDRFPREIRARAPADGGAANPRSRRSERGGRSAPRWWSSARAIRSTATSPATSRCASPRPRARIRASWRRPSSRRCRRTSLVAKRRDRRRRLHQFPPGDGCLVRGAAQASHAQGEAYGRSEVGAGRKVMVEFVSANPTGPMHVGHGRGAAYGATLANLLEATGHDAVPRVLHQRCRPADGHPRGQRLSALSRARAAKPCAFPSNGYAPTTSARWREALHAKRGDALQRPAAEVARGAPPDAPAGGDKDKHIDGLIENSRRRCSAPRSSIPSCCSRATRCWPTSATTSTSSACTSTAGTRSASSNQQRRRSTARSTSCAQPAACTRRTARSGSSRTEFGDDEDRVVVRANGEKTYFASDIAYHFDKRAARLRPADRRAGARTITATSRACAARWWRWASPATASRSA